MDSQPLEYLKTLIEEQLSQYDTEQITKLTHVVIEKVLLTTSNGVPLANFLESEIFLKSMTVFATELYLFLN